MNARLLLRACGWWALIASLVLAGPLAAYEALPECCKGECTDACPIEVRRAHARHAPPAGAKAEPRAHGGQTHDHAAVSATPAEGESCHAAAAPAAASQANDDGSAQAREALHHLRARHAVLRDPSRCGGDSVASSLGEAPRAAAPAPSLSPQPQSVARTAAPVRPPLAGDVQLSPARGPPPSRG